MPSFAIRLKQLRDAKTLTQNDLAEATGIPRSTIASWEAGQRNPELGSAQKLADYFGVTLDYLLGRSDDASPHPRPTKDPGLTIAAHRRGDFYEELPDEAKRQIDEYVEFIIQKYRERKEEK
jgi:transcriptional regulator with XRE-family HTH domain